MKVQITTTLGPITIQLNPDKAPKTVENFLSYVESGHYDGTIFHRVIKDFMVQCGGMDKEMNNKSSKPSIRNEANNGLNNQYGTIAMARTGDPHSALAQFFINTNDNPFLDFQAETQDGWGYCVFGEVIEGIEVVNNIEEKPTTTRDGHQDVPEEIIEIEKVTLLEEEDE
ncbi:MAG: peptidylprolyl isomerase [Proteobacteria bacterium]|nr:peptidylprolyl isomerase [Pseudomonadota bacterium]